MPVEAQPVAAVVDTTGAPGYLSIRDLRKEFDGFVAVDDVNLDVRKGEIFALLGGSGSGKSTLLRCLGGFETPTKGSITLDGQRLDALPPYQRPVNMMFQSYALFPHMTVEKNIAFGLKQDGMAKSEIDARVAEMLKLVKLEQYGKRKPHQLSGGQRQRVALARSVAKRPKVLLLDEPLGALDKKLREQTQFELMDLQVKLGMTFMVVTHDQEEAMTMADRIAVMDKGRIKQVATPAEVYEAPRSKFVADFIGNVNIIEGEVVKAANGEAEIATEKFGFHIQTETREELDPGQKVWYAVRPEKTRITREKPDDASINAVEGELWDIAYFGDMTVFHVRLDNGRTIKAASLNAVRRTENPLTYDERVWVSFDTDAGLVLTA